VTTIIDFALQRHGDSLLEARDHRLAEMRDDAVIDYSFHMMITDARDDALAEMAALIADGFPSFKIYMTYADKIVHDDALIRVLEMAAAHGGLVYLHCENDCAVTHLIQQHLARGDTAPLHHARSRPPEVEAEATYRAIMLAGLAGAPICIAHVTSADAAKHVAQARTRGQQVVCETCPQYLVLTEDVYDPARGFEAAKFVCSPPIRTPEHREALWRGLEDGSIQQVASDHAPFRFSDQKTQGREDFTRIPNGVPGIETRLPLLFTEGVQAGRITLQRFVELTSTNPAKIFGMYPQKGSLDIGADADLIVVDPNRTDEIDAANLHSAIDYNPFQGMTVCGIPTWTVSRGEVIVEQGTPSAARGRGRLVRRDAVQSEAWVD
jgi:dihydropyrimidinase